MPSIPLHDLHAALEKLRLAYYDNKFTEEEFNKTVIELTSEWIRIEIATKAMSHRQETARVKAAFHPTEEPLNIPNIVVEKDYEGFFERLVKTWCESKKTPWKCDTIVVIAGPWRDSAVTCWYDKDNSKTLHIDFHSELRRDFGNLSREDTQAVIDTWM
jgi:hypothetical protein